ncbi:DUF4340 domain-containing protein [Adhaeribacter sp. BT258]|uniref:DUF4340 domain-containing protein n=1 Tax=Adhaeribacter terrigena TaxID=2793070 RepID=A0ABS1C5I1_9BACT|nr:DUF4340 domain-containing protein [Adhaeribacter terrigena]
MLLVLLLVLVGAAAYFFTNKGSEKSTLNTSETAFTVTDTAAVTKIFISAKSGASNTLTRQENGRWLLNDKYEARQDKINNLLETMHRMEVKRPADKASRNLAIRDFATMGKKVEVFQHGKLSKVFYVGQSTDNDLGTYFIMEGSENPYVLHIPGFNGFINTRFDIVEDNWRSVPVFRSNAQSIQELKVEYTGDPQGSFTVTQSNGKYTVSGLKETDQENVKAYLDNYNFINGVFFVPNPQNRISDSLALRKPVAIITVKDTNPEKSREIKLFPKDIDNFLALNEKKKEIMQVQTFVFNRLLIRKDGLGKK